MNALSKVSLREKFSTFEETWSPKIVATANDFAVKIAKIEGEFVWHHHDEEDEVFLIVAGGIRMQYRRDGLQAEVAFGPGELLTVPHGMEHRPIAEPGTQIVLFEKASTRNTGDLADDERAAHAP
ncbi:MAG: cupin domain-containing protein [Candidatus Eremiobacteraeota bacterium]|nr:cupin domain-containing protein [Candidatus Eremiobacteraeota bacterium]MBC5826172.1 cupin domain-containing protein [Candidatus Eremiobacteraeota bacterium]